MKNLDSVLKSKDITLLTKVCIVKAMVFHSQGCGHIQLTELDGKEGRTPKNWCLQTVVVEKTLESPLDSKDIKPDGRTDAEAETTGSSQPRDAEAEATREPYY